MSRIGKKIIEIPQDVTIKIDSGKVKKIKFQLFVQMIIKM